MNFFSELKEDVTVDGESSFRIEKISFRKFKYYYNIPFMIKIDNYYWIEKMLTNFQYSTLKSSLNEVDFEDFFDEDGFKYMKKIRKKLKYHFKIRRTIVKYNHVGF